MDYTAEYFPPGNITLTISSERAYKQIRMGGMTPAMAAEYLREGRLDFRSFSEILSSFYPGDDLSERLINAFQEGKPASSRASTAKNVRNWLSGRSKPGNRKDIFHIAFALGLSEEQADFLLGHCTACGIHYRDGQDIVFSWFLRNGLSFSEAEAFYASLPDAPYVLQVPPTYTASEQLTQEMRNKFLSLHTQSELRTCYLNNLHNLGVLHLRAYHYFTRFMQLLIHPSGKEGAPEDNDYYSMETVMEKYLSLHMPSERNRQNYSTVKKLIKYNWPNATRLKNIRLRKEDVPRKLILLLYIVTENLVDDGYSEFDEEYLTMQERLEDHWYSINAILTDCGMPLLDPREPFDWLVLYALAVEEDEPMSERLEQVIDALFAEEEKDSRTPQSAFDRQLP